MKKDNVIKINRRLKRSTGDLWLLLIAFALVIFGIIAVFSASYYCSIDEKGNPYYYLYRHLMLVGVGLVGMLVTMRLDYHIYKYLWLIAYLGGLGLLVLVLIPGVGSSVADSVRWIRLGPITIMPGEIAKFCMIIFTTGFLKKSKDNGFVSLKDFIKVMVCAIIYAGLILLQPNMSTAVIVVAIPFIMLFIAGAQGVPLFATMGIGAAACFAAIKIAPYRMARYTSFVDPFKNEAVFRTDGWNGAQSLIALGTGKLFGKGIGNSVQKNLYLPMPQNDFILAVIGEETGFIGIAILIVGFTFLIYRGIRIALRAKDFEGTLLAVGFTTWIAIQVLMHLAVVTSSMPPTGVVLPFISYGGNATVLAMASIGILYNISRLTNLKER